MNVFDFDKTIYDGDSSLDFWFFCLKKDFRLARFFPRQIFGAILYAARRISKEEFKSRFFTFFAGISDINAFVREFWNANERKIKPWYKEMQKDDDCVISASPEILLSEICTRLGIKNLIATKVDSQTGRLVGKNCHSEQKCAAFREKFKNAEIGAFYSDSKSDEPMAKIAKNAFLVRGEKINEWEKKIMKNYFTHFTDFYKGKPDFYSVLKCLLTIFFIAQIFLVCYINLTQMKYHIGYDASTFYLRAFEMWKQGKVFNPQNFVHQTTFFFDSPAPIAAFLMNFFHNIFLSYGIANLLVDFLLIFFLYKTSKSLNISNLGILMILNIFLSPHVPVFFNNGNDLGYVSSILTSMGCYSVKLLIGLIFVYSFLFVRQNSVSIRDFSLICSINCALFYLQGISSGFYLLLIILLPMIFFVATEFFIDNSIKIFKKEYLLIYFCIVVSLLGKITAIKVFHFTSKDTNQVWCGLLDFWKNVGSILLGFFELLAALPYGSNVKILTRIGIRFSFGLGIALISIIAFVEMIKKITRNWSDYKNHAISVFVVLCNILIYAFCYSTYGALIFEARYLIIPFIFMLFCLAGWIDSLKNALLFKKFGVALLSALVLFSSVFSYHKYIYTRIDTALMDKIKEKVAGFDSPIIYFSDSNFSILARNMRVYDTDKIYRAVSFKDGRANYGFWGDYTYYSHINDYNGSVIFITNTDFFSTQVPVQYKNAMKKVCDFDKFEIYEAEKNIFALDTDFSLN